VTSISNARDAVYLVQLAAREIVSDVTLDELLEGRDALTRVLEEDSVPKAARFGVRVKRGGDGRSIRFPSHGLSSRFNRRLRRVCWR